MQIVTNQFQKELKEHGDYAFPLLISQEKLSKYESGSFLWHWHPEIELTYITKGEMIYKVNHNTYHLQKGDGLFGNTGTLHMGCQYGRQDCEYTSVTFDSRLIYGYEGSLMYQKYVKPLLQNFALPAIHLNGSQDWHTPALQLITNMLQTTREESRTFEMDMIILLEQFWRLLFLHGSSAPEETPLDKRNYERIRQILSYIENNYASELTLDHIAQSIHLCKSECSRMFKKYMKMSLFEFILQYRIEKSIEYLGNSNYCITEIAHLVGFHDSNYFTKVFREQKGCPPSRFRRNMGSVREV